MQAGDSTFNEAMASDPAVATEVEEVDDEPEDAGKDYKTGWPELQKDMAPHALLVPANRCISRHLKKLDDLLMRFNGVDVAKRTTLQSQ